MRWLVVLITLSACSRVISRPQVNPCDQNQQCRPGYFCDPGTLECAVSTGAECNVKGRELPCSRDVGECHTGVRVCVDDHYTECSGVEPSIERCDGLDNDCDDETDETFTELSAPCTVGRGACQRSGVLVCDGLGAGTTCSVVPGDPVTETCNGVDDDCDGAIDNNPIDAPVCPNQVGVCNGARQRCVNAAFVPCDAAAYGKDYDASADEQRCDNLDNDCDGLIDEGYVLKAQDLVLSELVVCPQQTWNDGIDTFSGKLLAGGNGVPFDDVPATIDLPSGKVADNTWFELESRLACATSTAGLKFFAGQSEGTLGVFVPDVSRGEDGLACGTLQAFGRCVYKGSAGLRGSDNAGFTRVLRVSRADNFALDTLSVTSPGGCPTSCRLFNVRGQPLSGCCEGESYTVTQAPNGIRSVALAAATPMWPNDIRTIYRPPNGLPQSLDTEVTLTEVLALAATGDVNGDNTASASEDDFVEIAVQQGRKIDLGRTRLIDTSRGGDPVLHQFACFAPVDGTRRAVIFGGARGPLDPAEFFSAMVLTSSRGDAIFDLQRATAMSVEIETPTGGTAARMTIDATALSGTSVQSRNRCVITESTSTLACECSCRGADASCTPTCATACESPTALEACFSPGE